MRRDPDAQEDVASQIARAAGPSGENAEYLFNLADAMRGIGVEDAHLFELERMVRAIRAKKAGGDDV